MLTIKREWQNVLQHMHPNGEKSDLGKNEGDIIRLLNHGLLLETNIQTIFDSMNAKGIEVVKNTDAKYDIYSKQGDYTSPTFYAAANPEQYDQSVFNDYKDASPFKRSNNDIYNV